MHGVGELFQGNISTDSIFIESWDQGPIAMYLGGDPAITVIPNFMISGILTLLVSFVTIAWSIGSLKCRRDGLILIFISIAMLLVGGGGGPPILGLLAGIAGLGINSPHLWWHAHLPSSLRNLLGKSWPWIFSVSVLNGIFLILGHVVAAYFFGSPVLETLFFSSFLFAVFTLIASIITGIAFDLLKRAQEADT